MSKLSSWKTILFFCVFCAATAIASPAQAGCSAATPCFKSLASFNGTDGELPEAALVQGRDGNFYGTSVNGGANDNANCHAGDHFGCGTVFKITPGGTLTPLYSFCSKANCTDGANPEAGLILGTDGNFYGTTYIGGAYTSCEIGISGRIGCGTIFKITPSGMLTTLHSFDATDGAGPVGLIQATDGNFYGITNSGGANSDGTIFKITPGALTTLHNFDGTDGDHPNGLLQATNGNFYGTTFIGGAGKFCVPSYGCGTVFKITGGTLTTLYSFCSKTSCTDGTDPSAPLVQATNGNFYGTTNFGGAACWAWMTGRGAKDSATAPSCATWSGTA